MIPKVIHLCWFSNDPYPLEIKICLETWQRILPDFEIKYWGYEEARNIGCRFINEALDAKKWAFAADVVRFYAVYSEGGIYMDSDIYVRKRFDRFIPERGFVTFHEVIEDALQLQAAFFMGEKGNEFCKRIYEYYQNRPFVLPDGTFDMVISPVTMLGVAREMGYRPEDVEQHLSHDTVIYPCRFVTPCKSAPVSPDAFAKHRTYGSWRDRKFGRKIELFVKHVWTAIRYAILKR